MRNFIYLIFFLVGMRVHSQELNCTVNVNLMANTTSINPSVFTNLKRAITEFMNNRKWTDENIQPHQKINATITINILDASKENTYKCDFTIQSERPVFNSTYTSPILRHIDQGVPIEYIENQPLDYSDQNFFGNLTSILAFYAHFIIGMHNETFAPKGGQIQFEKCNFIANNVPPNHSVRGEPAMGWAAAEAQDIKGQRTRIGFLLAYINSNADVFRNFMYQYHLEGMDMLADNPDKAKENIEKALDELSKINTNHYMYRQLMGAKVEEIINIFKDSPPKKAKMRELILKIEPTLAERIPK